MVAPGLSRLQPDEHPVSRDGLGDRGPGGAETATRRGDRGVPERGALSGARPARSRDSGRAAGPAGDGTHAIRPRVTAVGPWVLPPPPDRGAAGRCSPSCDAELP